MKIQEFGHQGDVWLTKIDKVLSGERIDLKNNKGEAILAYGEVTGHSHRITEGEVNYFKVKNSKNMFEEFLEVLSERAVLTHEEHLPFILTKGIYKNNISREYVAPEIERKVID